MKIGERVERAVIEHTKKYGQQPECFYLGRKEMGAARKEAQDMSAVIETTPHKAGGPLYRGVRPSQIMGYPVILVDEDTHFGVGVSG